MPRVVDRYRKLFADLPGRKIVGAELSRARDAVRILTGGRIMLTRSKRDRDARGRPIVNAHLAADYDGLIRLANDERKGRGMGTSAAFLMCGSGGGT